MFKNEFMFGNSTSSDFIPETLIAKDFLVFDHQQSAHAYAITVDILLPTYYLQSCFIYSLIMELIITLITNIYLLAFVCTWSNTLEGPRRHGAQCHFAQSHDPVGFAEHSESYIFVGRRSIIEPGTLHLVTVNDLLTHIHIQTLSPGVIQKPYTYTS